MPILSGPYQRQIIPPCRHFGHPTERAAADYRAAFWTSQGCPAEKLPGISRCRKCQLYRLGGDAKRWEGVQRPKRYDTPESRRLAAARKRGDKRHQI